MKKELRKIFLFSISSVLFSSVLLGCNPTSPSKKEDVIKAAQFTTSNKVKITFDAGEGYVDLTHTLHSTQINVNRGLKWKYIHDRMPKAENIYLANHTFNGWTWHGEPVDDNKSLDNDLTVTADYKPGDINFITLDAGTDGYFDTQGTTTKKAETFTANETYSNLIDTGKFFKPTPNSADKIFAGYRDENNKFIDLNTRINYEHPKDAQSQPRDYILKATYADVPKADFESDSWDSVVSASNYGLNFLKEAYKPTSGTFVGKTKKLTLNNGIEYTVRVIGEEEDITKDGTKAALTFEFLNVLIPNQSYDGHIRNNNSYNNSSLSMALDKLINIFPDCLKNDNGIRTVRKITNNGRPNPSAEGNSESCSTYDLKLFPLSAKEVNKNDSIGEMSTVNDAKVYSYYSDSSSLKSKDYIRTYKDPQTKIETASDYWLRSPDYQSSWFCNCVANDGTIYGKACDINLSKGVTPAFCIGTSVQEINVKFNVSYEGAKWGESGGTEDKTKQIKSSNTLSVALNKIPDPYKEGYTFVGWYTHTQSGALDQLYSSDTKVYINTYLYAHFIDNASLSKITFNGNNQYKSSGATRTLKNEDYITNITPSDSNDTHKSPNSTRGIEVINETEGKAITNFNVDTTGKLTIPAKYVTGDITINVKYGTIADNIEERLTTIANQDENFSKEGGKAPGDYAKQFFSIGDILNVSFTNDDGEIETLRTVLIEMGHSTDKFNDGTKDVVSAFTFDFLDLPNIEIPYSNQEKPSYVDSSLKTTVDGYFDKLNNSYLTNEKYGIKKVSHTTTKNYSSTDYDTFKSKMFVLSAAEHTNISEAEAPVGEGKQYEYYKLYNDHGKYKNGGLKSYWLRSSYVTENGYNRSYYVYSSGDYYSFSSYHKVNLHGAALAFCI